MPTAFVGIHLLLAGLVAAFGLWFLAQPCGGDLCLQGLGVLVGLVAASVGLAGAFVWRVWRRASPLLLWDSVVVAAGVSLAFSIQAELDSPQWLLLVIGQLLTAIGLPALIAAGAAVVRHRVETLLVLVLLAGTAVVTGEPGTMLLAIAAAALGLGWLLTRKRPAHEAHTSV